MINFYLPKKHIFILFFIFILLFYYNFTVAGFIFFIFLLLYLYAHRKYSLLGERESQNLGDLFKAPVNGRVISVDKDVNHEIFGKNFQKIGLVIPHFFESGIYLPVSSELEYSKKFLSRRVLRYGKNLSDSLEGEDKRGWLLALRTKKNFSLGLQMIQCFLGFSPEIWILPGDRGGGGMRFGYFPLGGCVFCYLPESYQLTVKIGDHLVAGKSILARERVE